ncbi:MAG: ChaN family lipoprotein, partial [Nitrospirota bacterium]|nr:ChaN family lipoprotein [Nitrospirota bacterium]
THGSGVERFLQVQLLWDETMAESVANYLKANRDHKMVVLAGGGHVQYGLGIPKRAFRRHPASYSIVMPITPRLYSLEKAEGKANDKDANGKNDGSHPRMMDIDMPDLPLLTADFMWAVDFKGLEGGKVMMGVQVSDEGGRVNVLAVAPKSAAERVGILAGDIILKVDGDETKTFADLTYTLRGKKVGDKLKVALERSGAVVNYELEFNETDRR